ncbi:MAG: GldG family protein [Clostridia bacterium]
MKNNKLLMVFKSRNFKYGTTAIVTMLITVALFVVVNLGAGLIYEEKDLTPEGLYSIGEQTQEILGDLDQEVVIYGLFDETKVSSQDNYTKVLELLKKYDAYDNVTVRFVDPEKNLGIINQLDPDRVLNITTRNFVVESQGRRKVLKYFDLFDLMGSEYTAMSIVDVGSKAEMAFTSAIYYVARDVSTRIYYVTGHNEYDNDTGYILASESLALNGFEVDKVNIRSFGGIPGDADILLIVNPQSDFHQQEISALKEYMKTGKSLFVLLDSMETTDRFPNLQGFLEDYNVRFGYTRIKENDPNYYLVGNPYIIMPDLYNTLINRNIRDSINDILARNVRSVEILRRMATHLKVEPLLITSDKAIQEGMYADIETQRGAAYVAAAVLDNRDNSRLIVSGTSEFMQDTFLYNYRSYAEDASKFLINSVNWLEGDIGQIFIEQKEYFQNMLSMNAGQQRTISVLVIYILPSLILLAGLIVYLRRRNL